MDEILSSTGTYKVNSKINGVPLDELSFVVKGDKIQPFFELSVADDPDVTALMVYLKDRKGVIASYKVIYTLSEKEQNSDNDIFETTTQNEPAVENVEEKQNDINEYNENKTESDLPELKTDENTEDAAPPDFDEELNAEELKAAYFNDSENSVLITDNEKNDEAAGKETETSDANLVLDLFLKDPLAELGLEIGDEYIIPVQTLDKNLPYFPVPLDLPIGRYTLVYSVLSGGDVIHRSEKPVFYIADAGFSFDGIQVSLPSVSLNPQFIPAGTVVMLETKLDFDSRMEPYIVWYRGKKIISEGSFSDGENTLLWKMPAQNGFLSLRAEVFPFADRQDLTGYKKGVSLLVSSKSEDAKILPEEDESLLYKYLFEGDLTDFTIKTAAERTLKPFEKNSVKWISYDNIYGLATGSGNTFSLPGISFTFDENGNAETAWRIVSRFKPLNEGGVLSVQFASNDVKLNLTNKESNIVLTLVSPESTVSKKYALPGTGFFISMETNFSVSSDKLTASLNFIDSLGNKNETYSDVSIEAEIKSPYKIILGANEINEENNEKPEPANTQSGKATVIWDELMLFNISAKLPEDASSANEVQEREETETEDVSDPLIS